MLKGGKRKQPADKGPKYKNKGLTMVKATSM